MLFQRIVEQEIGMKVVEEHQFHSKRKFRFDYAIPQLKIAIEQEGGIYNGKAHGSIKGILRDMEKYSLAASEGWLILRFTPDQIMTNYALHLIAKTVKCRLKEGWEYLEKSGLDNKLKKW
jgi:very-short-patch-repair endonuclease